MPKGALSKRHVEGIGEGSLIGTLSCLLQLTSEVVLVFDGAGRVLLANDEATHVFGFEQEKLVGADVRSLFPDLEGDGGETAMPMSFSPDDLPFECDGSTSLASCRNAEGLQEVLRVRCERVHAPGDTYLLVGRSAGAINDAGREYDRAFEELKRANKRLSGAFKIVLDTIDTADMGELFGRVLDEISETMEADGTLAYLAESDGFRLRGASRGLDVSRTPRFMTFGRTVEAIATREGRTVRLRVQAPTSDELRAGKLTYRNIVNEDTREVIKIKASLLPPFTSFMVVPVWFGGHVIAIIEVGWEKQHPLFKEDAGLLNSMGHYLSVQLVGAFASLRSQKAARLDTLQNDLREELLSVADGSGARADSQSALERLDEILNEVAAELEAALVPLGVDTDGTVSAELPLTGKHDLLANIDDVVAGFVTDGAAVVDLRPSAGLSQVLHGLGEPCYGALVDLGEIGGARRAYLMLRPDGSEPIDEVEHSFLVRFAADVRDIAQGEEARAQDKRISQALQLGMRNELQDVEGITAQGIYSSATAAAFVGGDFYDLIRLPGHRACVIMGDVSGKGVEAASVSAAVKTALGAYSWEGLAPARMVRSLNDFLLGFSRVETFATLFVGIIDLEKRTITYCSAGHPPALLVHGDEISILDVQSGVVGAFPDISYRDGRVRFESGDLLILYTDGTTEARAPEGAFFGEQGLRDMVMRECGPGKPFEGLLDRFLATLDDFTGQRLDDDVAMVCLRLDGLGTVSVS